MGMRGNGRRGIGHQQAAGHSQVYDPLQAGRLGTGKIEDNVFAHAIDAFDTTSGKLFGHQLRRRLEGFRLFAEPGGVDAVPTQTLIHPAGDGFNFRQFGHGSSLSLSQVLGRYPEALYHQESEPAAPPPDFLYAALDKSACAAFFTESRMRLIDSN